MQITSDNSPICSAVYNTVGVYLAVIWRVSIITLGTSFAVQSYASPNIVSDEYADPKPLKSIKLVSNVVVDEMFHQELALLLAAYKKIGFKVEIERMPIKRAVLKFQSGQTDGVTLVMKGFSKAHGYGFEVAEPLSDRALHIVVNRKSQPVVSTDLSTLCFAYYRGAAMHLQITSKVTPCVIPANNPEQVLQMVDRGRVDATLTTVDQYMELSRKLELENIIIGSEPHVVARFVHVVDDANQHLLSSLSEAIRDLKRLNQAQIDQIGSADGF